MVKRIPFFRSIPYRNIVLDLTEPPYPQSNGREWSIRNRILDDYDLFVCDSGTALFETDGQSHRLSEGMALLLAPGQKVSARTLGDRPVRMLAQHFMLYLFRTTDFFRLFRYRPCVSLKRWNLYRPIAYQISRIVLTRGDDWSPIDTSPLFMVLLRAFIEEAFIEDAVHGEGDTDKPKSGIVLRFIDEIENRFTDPHLLERLMASSCYGYSHTANIFKRYTGRSVKAFITDRRLQAAREILLKGGSVREAASAAGYGDEFYFSRVFRKYIGISPRMFRERL